MSGEVEYDGALLGGRAAAAGYRSIGADVWAHHPITVKAGIITAPTPPRTATPLSHRGCPGH
eukprot:scaffold51292_cov57-Phaeocystis_antarctica.AAC.1